MSGPYRSVIFKNSSMNSPTAPDFFRVELAAGTLPWLAAAQSAPAVDGVGQGDPHGRLGLVAVDKIAPRRA